MPGTAPAPPYPLQATGHRRADHDKPVPRWNCRRSRRRCRCRPLSGRAFGWLCRTRGKRRFYHRTGPRRSTLRRAEKFETVQGFGRFRRLGECRGAGQRRRPHPEAQHQGKRLGRPAHGGRGRRSARPADRLEKYRDIALRRCRDPRLDEHQQQSRSLCGGDRRNGIRCRSESALGLQDRHPDRGPSNLRSHHPGMGDANHAGATSRAGFRSFAGDAGERRNRSRLCRGTDGPA